MPSLLSNREFIATVVIGLWVVVVFISNIILIFSNPNRHMDRLKRWETLAKLKNFYESKVALVIAFMIHSFFYFIFLTLDWRTPCSLILVNYIQSLFAGWCAKDLILQENARIKREAVQGTIKKE